MTELNGGYPPKAQLVRQGFQHIVGVVGLIVGITGAVFSWTGESGKANIVVLSVLVFAFIISILVLFIYLIYEKAGSRLEDITGDLTEGYSCVRERHNRIVADAWLLAQVMRLVPTGVKSLF